jgi:serine/threonine protein kinase
MINGNNLPEYTKIRDTYTIEYLIGKGSYGSIYRTRHKYMGIQALKIFNPGTISLEQEAELFNEAYVLSKITHPNLVRVYEANTFKYDEKKYYYIAMEYIKGGTLADFIKKKGSIRINEAIDIEKDICRGLSKLHMTEPPIIHRDIKLQNIMVEIEKGIRAKISDFGLVRNVDAKTKITEAAGTLFYMPPEAFWNYETTASDVFSAGIIFYIILTGTPPYENPTNKIEENEQSAIDAIIVSRKKKPKPPSFFNNEVDQELDEIVLKALESDVTKRYQDANKFLNVIELYEQNKFIQSMKNIEKALELGKQYANLKTAICLLEKSISQCPSDKQIVLNEKYKKILDNWKKGIVM